MTEARLENVERFELNVLAFVLEEVHNDLEISLIRDESRHDVEISAVKKDLAQQFQRLPLRDVVCGRYQCAIHGKEAVVVFLEIFRNHWLVSSKNLFEIGECIARYAKFGVFYVVRERIQT